MHWTKDDLARHKAKHRAQYPEQEGDHIDSMDPATAKKKARKQPESDMQIALFSLIRLQEDRYHLLRRVFHVPNGGWRHKATAGRLWSEGVRPGVPDVFVDVPYFNEHVDWTVTTFHGLRIELKAPGGKMSDDQTDWLAYYREAGYRAEICFSWEEAFNIICDYLGYGEIKV